MSFSVRPVVATLLLAGSAALLTACDYAPYSPGKNLPFKEGFGTPPPGYTNAEINRDSINYKQEGRAAAAQSTASAPAGKATKASSKK